MRLTNDGIKERGAWDWFNDMPGSRTDGTAVSPEDMEYEESIRANGQAAVNAEALYAEALEAQFGAPALAETVELDEQIAA